MIFVKGPQAHILGKTEAEAVNHARERGVYLSFFTIEELCRNILTFMVPLDTQVFYASLRSFAISGKFKPTCLKYIEDLGTKYNWI